MCSARVSLAKFWFITCCGFSDYSDSYHAVAFLTTLFRVGPTLPAARTWSVFSQTQTPMCTHERLSSWTNMSWGKVLLTNLDQLWDHFRNHDQGEAQDVEEREGHECLAGCQPFFWIVGVHQRIHGKCHKANLQCISQDKIVVEGNLLLLKLFSVT